MVVMKTSFDVRLISFGEFAIEKGLENKNGLMV